MKTRVSKNIKEAATIIRDGGLVAFPTETVYGLGARAAEPAAVERIFEAKARPADNPLIAHIAHESWLDELTSCVTDSAGELMAAFFPGPITLVLPRKESVASIVTAGLDTIGVRMPDHPVALEFLRACAEPVAAPSANRSGRPSPTTWEAVYDDLGGRIDMVLEGEVARIGLESTVVDCTGPHPLVLRPGSVTLEDLRLVIPSTSLADAALPTSGRSPGTLHRHYRPDASVRIVDAPRDKPGASSPIAFIGTSAPADSADYSFVNVVGDVADYARNLFAFMRDCEKRGIEEIHCQRVEPLGIGKAVMDRLERAESS